MYFEHLIGKHKDTPIYYEAEAIFANFDDKVPIGTRIKIVKIEKENDKYMVHLMRMQFLSTSSFLTVTTQKRIQSQF